MTGKIDSDGRLYIKRGSVFKLQKCKKAANPNIPCGDDCPHFSEPNIIYNSEHVITFKTPVICEDRKLYFTELTDERV